MNPDDVLAVIERVAELATPKAQELWAIYYQQVLNEAYIMRVVATVISAVLLGVLISAIIRRLSYDEDVFVETCIWVAGLPFAVWLYAGAYMKAANPAYYVIMRLLESL